jgi:hypothetical protein
MFCKNCGKQLDNEEKFCSRCGTGTVDGAVAKKEIAASETSDKERHGFLTFWFISGLVMYIICLYIYGIALDDASMLMAMEMSKGVAVAFVVISFIGCISRILILNWMMEGFVLSCIASVIPIMIYPKVYIVVLGILYPLLEFSLLQLKKNGVSAWAHLKKINVRNKHD